MGDQNVHPNNLSGSFGHPGPYLSGAYQQQVAPQTLSLGGVQGAEDGRLWSQFHEQFKAGHQSNAMPQAVSYPSICFNEATYVYLRSQGGLVSPRRYLPSPGGLSSHPRFHRIVLIPLPLLY